MQRNVVIAGYARSPHDVAERGALAGVRPDDMAAAVVAALLDRAGVPGEEIEDLILGCAFPEAEQGLNMARLVALLAGLPESVPGVTVNRFCASSMQAIAQAAGAIQMGAGEAFVCAGVESMTRVPIPGYNPMPNPKLAADRPGAFMAMGLTAEALARKYRIARPAQEAFAVESQRRASAAARDGRFAEELVAIPAAAGPVEADGVLRPDTTAEGLAELKPAFEEGGTVTAGTSSPVADGASAVLVASEDFAVAHGLAPLARLRAVAVTGCAPEIMGIGPVGAARKALDRAGLTLTDIDVVELNEAFAVQVLAVQLELGLDPERTNLDGGAIALGHPLGASGARITGKAAGLLKREDKSLALAALCVGGGQGMAVVLQRA
jgi:acetyl-CoA acyltransferase